MTTSQRNIDSVDLDLKTQEKCKANNEDEKVKSCCCYNIKRVFRSKSHAKENEEVTEANDERTT